jgi:hypothetical protein
VKVVVGPGTFVNEAAEQIDEQLASGGQQAQRQAREAERVLYGAALARGEGAARAHELAKQAGKITLARYAEGLAMLGLRYGLSAPPSITDARFVSTLVFEASAKLPGTPKARFAYLFPSRELALVSVRMRAGLSEAARSRTIALIHRAVGMPQWRLAHGEGYEVTGEPAIVAELSDSIARSTILLGVAVLLVMALALGLLFTRAPRLLPLAIAVLALALTFGALAALGASLSIAQVAVVPVLVGLAVDYAIQFQSRVAEALEGEIPDARAAVVRAARTGGPAIAVAGAACMAALLVLTLSPVPTVRGFGWLLIAGIALALLCTFTVGSAVAVIFAEKAPRARVRGGAFSAAWRGARDLLVENPLSRGLTRAALVGAVRRPERVLGVGLVLALAGWGLQTQTPVQSDISRLVPASLPSLRGLEALERGSGVGGEIDLLVSARDLSDPRTIEWMSAYEAGVLSRFHYSSTRGCGSAELCPAFSLPDLFQGAAGHGKLTGAQVRALLGAIPPYFSQEVISGDRREATLAFGIRLMALDEQERVIEAMRSRLRPPAGVTARLVGLPVLAAGANAQLTSPWRRLLTLLGALGAVALVLLGAFRGDRRRALTPLIPVVLATGWSGLLLFAIRVELNPMSVTLGALVIALSTEFSVLLCEREREERLAGSEPVGALRRAFRLTGAAVTASGVSAIAGFGVLALSDIRMLRDFGVVTVIDLTVSLAGVFVALPAALVLAERGELWTLPARALASVRERLRPSERTRHETV